MVYIMGAAFVYLLMQFLWRLDNYFPNVMRKICCKVVEYTHTHLFVPCIKEDN